MPIPLHEDIVTMAKADALMLFEAVREDTQQKASERRKVAAEWRQRLLTNDPDELLATLQDAELNGIPQDEIAAWYAGRGAR